jgi:hypothetical protein
MTGIIVGAEETDTKAISPAIAVTQIPTKISFCNNDHLAQSFCICPTTFLNHSPISPPQKDVFIFLFSKRFPGS